MKESININKEFSKLPMFEDYLNLLNLTPEELVQQIPKMPIEDQKILKSTVVIVYNQVHLTLRQIYNLMIQNIEGKPQEYIDSLITTRNSLAVLAQKTEDIHGILDLGIKNSK